MKLLVTGANGFLGSWVCKQALEEGHQVTALVRNNSDLTELAGLPIEYVQGDVTDIESLKKSFKNKDYIFHLAGVVAYKKKDRNLMNKVNIEGTKNVVEVLKIQQQAKLLHLSSVVAVGATFEPVIQNENSAYEIDDLDLGYFQTKHLAEKYVLEAVQNKSIEAICINPSTIYGFADAKKGSRKTQVKVAQGRFPFYTNGGVNVVAVEDVVESVFKAIQYGKNGERYIVCSENLTIQKLFSKIATLADKPVPSILLPFPILKLIGHFGDLFNLGISLENAYTASMYHWFSHEKATATWGFQPKKSDYAIENSVRWMHDHGYLK